MKYWLILIAPLTLASCEAPGWRAAQGQVMPPQEAMSFDALYSQNCSGCHGPHGQGGVTVAIGSPAYLAIVDDATIRQIIAKGTPGTPMPAFAQNAGGMLTEPQIEALVRGIRSWANPDARSVQGIPPYLPAHPGDAAKGRDVFKTACAACHGDDGRGAVSVADTSYLSLVTDQHLRTVILTGMKNLGMPDWRGRSKPLSGDEITDVVAWLASQREPLAAEVSH